MKIRLGYVAIAKKKTVTFTNYNKISKRLPLRK